MRNLKDFEQNSLGRVGWEGGGGGGGGVPEVNVFSAHDLRTRTKTPGTHSPAFHTQELWK